MYLRFLVVGSFLHAFTPNVHVPMYASFRINFRRVVFRQNFEARFFEFVPKRGGVTPSLFKMPAIDRRECPAGVNAPS
jgi:hypothetical protein